MLNAAFTKGTMSIAFQPFLRGLRENTFVCFVVAFYSLMLFLNHNVRNVVFTKGTMSSSSVSFFVRFVKIPSCALWLLFIA